MAVSPTFIEESKRHRRISLTSLKNSIVRRSTRYTKSHSPSSEITEDANGDPIDNDSIKCPKTEELYAQVEDASEKGKLKSTDIAPNNDKHKLGIFKSLKKKFQWKVNIGGIRPFQFKTKQAINALDSTCSNYTISEESSSQGVMPAKSLVQPRLRYVKDSSNIVQRPHTLAATPIALDDNTENRLSCATTSDDACSNATKHNSQVFDKPQICAPEPRPPHILGVELPPSPTRSLTVELLKLASHGWYWGPITRDESEEKLQDLPDGAFLVRDSSADRYLLSVSFRSSGKTFHARIEHSHGLFSFYSHPGQEGFESIVELVNHSMKYSKTAVFCYSQPRAPFYPAFPVRLVIPVSRFRQVRSLQYLCRFVIRQNTRVDNIQKLPLPTTIKGYIEEAHY